MKSVYFDNAATTKMLPEVIKVMSKAMEENFGNPSSTHQTGRKARVAIETARKKIAKRFNISAPEVVFTSGGTEGNNLVLRNAVENLGVKTIFTTKIEHHAVLDVVMFLQENFDLSVVFLELNSFGEIDLTDFEEKLSKADGVSLVSLMYVNNEIGNILPIKEVSSICEKYDAFFHTDAVQAVGHFNIDIKDLGVDFLVASAHKFHGPKGVGFVCVNKAVLLRAMILGGGQERGVRSGTENTYGIIAMEKALDISLDNLDQDNDHIWKVKKYFKEKLTECFSDIVFNGLSGIDEKSTNTIISVRFPLKEKNLLFNLDLSGIAASSGSACQSGANKVSHVLKEILNLDELEYSSIRFSFSKFSTLEEVDFLIDFFKKRF
ncbi:cysteine desulfurase family protein [Tenacibaculum sp. M341]|uniref:cysteine desulfurase family protein n=1 Tax=Tenacibaculum sp. M341 TaxID=2530339 RepID=UPI00104F33F9|nr:cysteine desulfurase family protein [Tenacibaculum sp. M341]TCI84419.1 cysteine desulfurase [Tenacibaculum sp. M341]